MFDSIELIARTKRKLFIICFIFSSIPLIGLTYSFFKDPVKESLEFNEAPIALSLLIGFLIFVFLFFGYKSFDKRIMVQIDKSGIWTRKFKLIEWSNIWYLYLKELKGKHGDLFLYVKIHSPEKELKITLTHLDKSEEQIIEVLKLFSRNHNIQFLEKEPTSNNFV